MEKYTKPEMEQIILATEDVITASEVQGEWDELSDWEQ